jgi:hypothetical protein
MRFLVRSVVLVAVMAAANLAGAQARSSVPRDQSITLGLSKGAGALTCPFCTGTGKGGVAGLLSIDRSFRRGVRLGLELDWWMHAGASDSRSVMAAIPMVQFYPASAGPLFLKVGFGVSRFSATSDEEELRTIAPSGIIGLGWEFRLSQHSLLVPYVSWLNGAGGNMRLNGAHVTDFGGVTLLQYGIAWSRR